MGRGQDSQKRFHSVQDGNRKVKKHSCFFGSGTGNPKKLSRCFRIRKPCILIRKYSGTRNPVHACSEGLSQHLFFWVNLANKNANINCILTYITSSLFCQGLAHPPVSRVHPHLPYLLMYGWMIHQRVRWRDSRTWLSSNRPI